jgi:cytidylate kinase
MSKQQNNCGMSVITISGQYGSGSDDIAAHLARRLHWQISNAEIITRVAAEVGLSETEAIVHDEHAFGALDRFLLFMTHSAPEVCFNSSIANPQIILGQEKLCHEVQQQVIGEIARTGQAVIVGRGAQVLLAGQRNVLHVRVVAPFTQRVQYVRRESYMKESAARTLVRKMDRKQAYFYQSCYHRDVDDPALYDLVINSSTLDLERQVDLICLALEHKALQLQQVIAVPVERMPELASSF